MKTLKERTEVQQAKLDGKEIEWIYLGDEGNAWRLYPFDDFNWSTHNFRVKPKPMEIWVNVYKKGCTAYHSKNGAVSNAQPGVIGTCKFIQAPDDEQ